MTLSFHGLGRPTAGPQDDLLEQLTVFDQFACYERGMNMIISGLTYHALWVFLGSSCPALSDRLWLSGFPQRPWFSVSVYARIREVDADGERQKQEGAACVSHRNRDELWDNFEFSITEYGVNVILWSDFVPKIIFGSQTLDLQCHNFC